MRVQLLVATFALFSATVFAGSLDVLPNSNNELQEKISAFIKPGGGVTDAVSLLESSRFKCEKSKVGKSDMLCTRSDVHEYFVRHYDVLIVSKGGRVRSVGPLVTISARKP